MRERIRGFYRKMIYDYESVKKDILNFNVKKLM